VCLSAFLIPAQTGIQSLSSLDASSSVEQSFMIPPGATTVTLRAPRRLPAGVYLLRLTQGAAHVTQKITLVQ
jgi:hypothetical protein